MVRLPHIRTILRTQLLFARSPIYYVVYQGLTDKTLHRYDRSRAVPILSSKILFSGPTTQSAAWRAQDIQNACLILTPTEE